MSIALSVVLFLVMFVLTAIPLLVGVFQARGGIRALVRRERSGWQLAAAGVGVVVGVLWLPGSMFNPDGEAWRTAVAGVLIAANATAGYLLFGPTTAASASNLRQYPRG